MFPSSELRKNLEYDLVMLDLVFDTHDVEKNQVN